MEHADGQQVQRFVTDSKRSLEPYLNEYGLVIYSNKSTLRRNPVVFYGLNPGCDPDIGHPIRWTIEKSLDHFEDGFKILQETRDSAGSSLNLINDQCWPGPRFEKDSKKGFSRLLKNCVEQAIPVLVRVISSAGRFFVSFFRAAGRSMWSFQRRSETLRPGLTALKPRRPSGFACAPGCKPRKQR